MKGEYMRYSETRLKKLIANFDIALNSGLGVKLFEQGLAMREIGYSYERIEKLFEDIISNYHC